MGNKDLRRDGAAGNHWGRLSPSETHVLIISLSLYFIEVSQKLRALLPNYKRFNLSTHCVSHSSFRFPVCRFLWLSSPTASLSLSFFLSLPFVVLTFGMVLPPYWNRVPCQTARLGLIPSERCHSTCKVWQPPDEADWKQPLFQWNPLIRSHFKQPVRSLWVFIFFSPIAPIFSFSCVISVTDLCGHHLSQFISIQEVAIKAEELVWWRANYSDDTAWCKRNYWSLVLISVHVFWGIIERLFPCCWSLWWQPHQWGIYLLLET